MSNGAVSEQVTVVVKPPLPDVHVSVQATMPDVEVVVAEVGLAGPAGERGPAGPPGRNSDGTGGMHAHRQDSPAAQWTITHDLGAPREPTLLLDVGYGDPRVPVWADVEHPDLNTTLIILPSPATGWAYL